MAKRISWKTKYEELKIKYSEILGFKSAIDSVNSSQEKFQKKIVRIEKIHYVVAACIAILTGIQAFLFYNQNQLIQNQNRLFENQNSLVDRQNELFEIQNIKIDTQLIMLNQQNSKIGEQTGLYRAQISLLKRQMNQEQYITLWPKVVIDTKNRDTLIEIKVRNAGVGPAELRYAEIKYNDKRSTWIDILINIYGRDVFKIDGKTLTITGNVLSPGQEFVVFNMIGKEAKIFESHMKYIKVCLCYCSVMEDCWKYERKLESKFPFQETTKVENCNDKREPLI